MERIGIKYGLLTALGLVLYFLLMKVIGLVHVVELRFLNAIILTIGIIMAIKALKNVKQGKMKYLQGIGVAYITALVATVLFAIFMVVYIKAFDDKLLEVLTAENLFGERMSITPGLVIFIVLMLEGMISGVMIGFIAMQWFKSPDHKLPGSP